MTGFAFECLACGAEGHCEDFDVEQHMCPICGTDDPVVFFTVTACPAEHPADCTDDDHHFGLQAHTTEVSD